jgi:hypothetical protein
MLLAKACSDGVSGRPQAARARKRRRKRRIDARLAAGRGRCEGDFVGGVGWVRPTLPYACLPLLNVFCSHLD